MMRIVKWVGSLAVVLIGLAVFLSEKDEVVVVRTGFAGAIKESRVWIVDGPDGPMIRGAAAKTWVANVRARPAVELYRGGTWMALSATELDTPAAKALVHERMLAKYGVAERLIAAIYGLDAMVVFRLDSPPLTGMDPMVDGRGTR